MRIDTSQKAGKKASVHFSPASPVIIPPREASDEEEETDDEEPRARHSPINGHRSNGEGERATALYDFAADGQDELSVAEGEHLVIVEKDGDEWWKCRNAKGAEGVVPASYLEVIIVSLSLKLLSNCIFSFLRLHQPTIRGFPRQRGKKKRMPPPKRRELKRNDYSESGMLSRYE